MSISGGRNMALKQMTEQTGTYSDHKGSYPASLAVDGNSNSNFYNLSCTHTSTVKAGNLATWKLTMELEHKINRITLYNRGGYENYRLKNFKLETLDSKNNILWTHNDLSNVSDVYRINTMEQHSVKAIRISVTNIDYYSKCPILTLCEVLVFGDCDAGTWGPGCERTCPKECKSLCHQETGKCYQCIGYQNPPYCSLGRSKSH
uniref:Uncharacterized protein n=1 Tax=Biomphalaria glabrata TaxID=6526 RepID=A0A2C9LNT1_BIOGL